MDLLRRAVRALRAAPRGLRIALGGIFLLALWGTANWIYHALHKPTELLFPLSSALAKTPPETWREYGHQFRQHATPVITPEFLAALAQVESAGNPLAQTYWIWDLSWHPLKLYRPASSAVGIYQITDGTFAQAEPECRNAPAARGSCWLDSYYTRLVPSQAIELTATHLDRTVAATIRRQRIAGATLRQKQNLAAVIHLCGTGAGETYARRGLRLISGQRCGDHDVGAYLERIHEMKRLFARLASNA